MGFVTEGVLLGGIGLGLARLEEEAEAEEEATAPLEEGLANSNSPS